MLPALPTGRQCTSGASPSASTTSNAAVFWPSSRSLLTELTSATGYSAASLRTISRQSSKLPSTWSSLAPCTSACTILPIAILPLGTITAQSRPARAAASVTATVIPRSLNDPVGLAPSTLRYTSQPVLSDSTGACSSGVPPSPSVTGVQSAGTGSRSAYSAITPRHGPAAALTGGRAVAGLIAPPRLRPAARCRPRGPPAS